MKRYIIRRLLWGVLVLLLVSLLIFTATRIGPDPVLMMTEGNVSEEDLNTLRERFGLNKPLPVQYFNFIYKFIHGDFGESLYFGRPAVEVVLKRLPPTFQLVLLAQILALGIGLVAGLLAATSRGKWVGNVVRLFSIIGLSMPSFWIALLCLLVFTVVLGWLPASGRGTIAQMVMPVFSLGWYFSAGYTRITHSSLLEVLNQEYIKLARIKGLPEKTVVAKHALRNALIPVVTLAGMNMVVMISAAVAIETVFSWPGLGFLVYQGALARDFNIVQGSVMIISALMVMSNLVVDVLYAYLDPRIRYT